MSWWLGILRVTSKLFPISEKRPWISVARETVREGLGSRTIWAAATLASRLGSGPSHGFVRANLNSVDTLVSDAN